jgi:hypothetical protein
MLIILRDEKKEEKKRRRKEEKKKKRDIKSIHIKKERCRKWAEADLIYKESLTHSHVCNVIEI